MTRREASERRTEAEVRTGRRYNRQFGAAMVLYVLLLVLSQVLDAERGTPLAVALAVLPILPLLWIVVALLGHLRRIDEMQRQLLVKSLAAGFGGAMLVAVTVGMLRIGGLDVPMPEWIVFSGGMSAWGIAAIVLTLRVDR